MAAPTVVGTPVAFRKTASGGIIATEMAVTVPSGTAQLRIWCELVSSANPTFSAVSWNGNALTMDASSQVAGAWGAGNGRGAWFYLDSPTAGTGDVLVSASGGYNVIKAHAISVSGCELGVAHAFGGSWRSTAAHSTDLTDAITTTADDCLLLAGVGFGDGDNHAIATTGQTVQGYVNGAQNSRTSSKVLATAGATTMQFNIATANKNALPHGIIALEPASTPALHLGVVATIDDEE